MATEVTTSKQYSLNWRDATKGLLMAVLGAALSPIIESLNAGVFTMDWKHIAAGAITAGVAYILKNFFTPAQTVITGTPLPKVNETNDEGETDLVGGRPDDRK